MGLRPTTAEVIAPFQITSSGLSYLKRNKLQHIVLTALQTAINATKEDTVIYINTYWPKDTWRTSDNAVMFLRKNKYYDLSRPFITYIGSDVEYFKYLLDLAERMRRKGKNVNWTNYNTRKIETDILGYTTEYYIDQLKYHLEESLGAINMKWIMGKGAMPLHPTTQTESGRIRFLPRFYGKQKPLQLNLKR